MQTASNLSPQQLPESDDSYEAQLARYRAIAEMSSDWYWESGPDHRFTLLCHRFEGLMKVSPEAFAGEFDLIDVVATTNRRIRERIAAVRTGRTFCGYEVSLIDGGGTLRSFELCGRAVHAPDGRYLGHLGAAHEITRKKTAETALSESEDRYRSLIELAPEAVLILSEESVLYANGSAVHLFGYSQRHDLEGQGIANLLSPGHRETAIRNIANILSSGEPDTPRELEILRSDGGTVDVEAKSGPIVWQGRSAVMTFVRDISWRRRAEERLSRSERQFRDLVDGSLQGIAIHTESGIVYANETMSRIFGYSADELIGMDVTKLTPPEDIAVNRERNAARLRGEPVPQRYELKGIRRNGRKIWLATLARLVEWEGSAAIQSAVVDITEQRVAQEALHESRELYRDLIEASSDWLWEVDADLRFSYFSESMGNRFGVSPNSLLGRRREEIVHPRSRNHPAFRRHVEDLESRRAFRDFTYRVQSDDGTSRWFRTSGQPRFNQNGKFIGYRGVGTDVTVEMEARDEAARKSAYSSSIVENMPEGVVLLDRNLRVNAFNSRFVEIFALSQRPIREGSEFNDILQWQVDGGLLRADFARWLRERGADMKEQRFHVEVGLENGDTVLLRTTPVPDGGILCTYQDITGRKRAERALRSNEERFRDFAEASSHWLWEMGPDLRFTYVSEGVRRGTDESPEDFVGKSPAELAGVDAETTPMLKRMMDIMGRHEPFQDFMFVRRVQDGREMHFALSAKPVLAEDGRFLGYRGVARDITEQVNALDELGKIRTQLQNAIENINEGFSLFDKDKKLVLCNSRFREMFWLAGDVVVPGASLETILRASAERGLYAGEIGDIDAWVAERLRQHSAPQGAFEENLSDGRWIRVSEVCTEDGAVVGIRTDVTALRKIEEHLRASEKLNALGQLAGGVAHDFNNILMIVDGYAKRALERPGDPECVRASLSEVLAATDRAKSLTGQLLVFGRRKSIEKQVIRAANLVWEAEGLVKPLLGETIQVEVRVADKNACVETDPGQMSQALVNLAINARDAMPLGGKLMLSLDVEDGNSTELAGQPALEGRVVKLSMEDHGTGMDKDTLSHIFEPFFTTKEPGKGTGLGLAMVYGFVQESGGTIEVESEMHVGTTVTIRLPLVDTVPVAKFSSVEKRDLAARGETILFAEDNVALRRLVQESLESLGYTVLSAGDGFEALELEGEHDGKIDLLLSDVVMPGLDGIELSRIVREIHPDIKIVLISGYPARGQEAGEPIDDDICLLRKPIDIADLATAIRGVLNSPQQGIAAAE